MTRIRTGWRRLITLVPLSIATLTPGAEISAQEPVEPTVHWAYASFFGTGWYKINDERSAFIVRAAPRWTVGKAGIDEQGNRDIAYTLRVPLTLGLAKFDFEDIPGILDPGNLTTASVNFSMDVDIPITRRFFVRPNAQVGYGRILGESGSAVTYKTEIRSKYTFQSGKLDWSLLADLGFVGYESDEGDSDDFAFAAAGAEFGYPIAWPPAKNDQTMLYWHFKYVDFLDEIKLQTGIEEFDSVANFWQIGVALGKRQKPIKFWFLNFDRLGIAYNLSTTGELRGVKFIFRSQYEL